MPTSEPTLAEFRAHLESLIAAQEPSLAADFLGHLAQFIDDYRREHAPTAGALPIEARLDAAGRTRAAWKETEPTIPGLIAEADAAGMDGVEIARRLGVTPSYVHRKIRQARD